MLKSHHADILNKPFSQIKDLKLYCPDDLDDIKQNHKALWQLFKTFILKIYQHLPHDFAKPHIENWCNGWQIRNHYFAYFKYEKYLGNAPIISVLLNKNRLIIWLDWHAYKAHISKSSLVHFNDWLNHIDHTQYSDFFYCHQSVGEYGVFSPMVAFDMDGDVGAQDGWYRLGRVLERHELDDFSDEALVAWAVQTIEKLVGVYECCHGVDAEW